MANSRTVLGAQGHLATLGEAHQRTLVATGLNQPELPI